MDRSPPGPTLVERADQALRDGPLHTLELARTALRLTGNPGAASAAVFALLGRDPRFHVDGEGVWRLTSPEPPGVPLRRLSFAVVDVETTGGSYRQGHRITELAIVEVRDGQVGPGFHTLVNPGRPIPPRIQGLTGITDAMVAGAPSFEGVVPAVTRCLEGRVFVAHNASFDWGFLHHHLLTASGTGLPEGRLCTVRMGRALVPGLRSYALDPLTRHFGIPIYARHRAHGDALATARLLLLLLARAELRGASDLPGLLRLLRARGRRRAGSRGLERE
jgi:DNA polymerase III epsilon subunit family exonuclease